MQIWVIVAHSHLQGISKNGKIPWMCKNDMKFMREITSAPHLKNGLLMGRKTFDSIGRVLPNRETIVVSSTPAVCRNPNLHTAISINDAIHKAQHELKLDVLWVFGGASIYDQVLQQFRECIDGFFITTVPEVACDTFIQTNLCDIVMAPNTMYRRLTDLSSDSNSIVLERNEYGTYELNAYSRLDPAEIKKEWAPILDWAKHINNINTNINTNININK